MDAVRCPGCKQAVVPARIPELRSTVLFEASPTWVLLARPGKGEPAVVRASTPHLCVHPKSRDRAKPYLGEESPKG